MEPATKSELRPCPSTTSGLEFREEIGLPELEPKHKIFLSHSGAQKEFVKQLCKDLEAEAHYPFFDQRPSSLLKGKKFAPEILAAAQHCRVAVVVLSEEYLTSKWPMLELMEFVRAKRSCNPNLDLFPLFFKLPVGDLSAHAFENRWKVAWARIAADDPRLDISLCAKALRELRGSNGLKLEDFQNSEVSYREAIVKEVSLLLPPDLLDDTSDVTGYDRLCKKISEMFVQDTADESLSRGTQKLGLYGMGGLGKTTMCRALCKHFHEDFDGRVCHVELGSKAPLDLQKSVLRKLLRLSKEVVATIETTSQGRKCMKDHMKQRSVFLVIDNISDDEDSRDEARAYLKAGFHPQSKIMITSRSHDIVKALFLDSESRFCKPMPNLTEEEAGIIFLQRAAPQRALSAITREEERILKACLHQCRFSPDGRMACSDEEGQYHPLALRALAVYYHEIDNRNLLLWEGHLGDMDKLKLSRESSELFRILGLQFSTFDKTKKLMFLDVALFYGVLWPSVNLCVSWLAEIHDASTRTVQCQLQHLKRLSIINLTPSMYLGDQEKLITMHDLYKEYAEWYLEQENDLGCVYHKLRTDSLPYALRCTPESSVWPHWKRIWLGNLKCSNLPQNKVQEWRNVVVLQLHSCTNLTVLDLHGFTCLRHLELVRLPNLEALHFEENSSNGNIIPICGQPTYTTLESLQFVILYELNSLKRLPDFSLCTSLRDFKMKECLSLTAPPNFKNCSQLQDLHMDWLKGQGKLPSLNMLTALGKLHIGKSCRDSNCKGTLKLEGLGDCTRLQERLSLIRLPIKSLPGLEKLTKLRRLIVRQCSRLKDLAGVAALIHLEELDISFTKIPLIPGVDRLLQLRTLNCTWNQKLSSLPDLHQLQGLKFLNTQGCTKLKENPRVPPDCVHLEHDKQHPYQIQVEVSETRSSVPLPNGLLVTLDFGLARGNLSGCRGILSVDCFE